MAIRTLTIPGFGTFTYDDAVTPNPKFYTDGVLQVNRAPVDPEDVVRLSDSGSTFAPAGSSYIVVDFDGTLTSERRLKGTTNQINLSDGGANGDLVLSTPQDINTNSDVQFNSIILDGDIDHNGTKVGFFGTSPVTQRSHIVDANGTLADITNKFNTLLAYLEDLGLLATS